MFFFRVFALASLSAFLASCSSLGFSVHADTRAGVVPFPRYVENVFRLQNSMTSQVMMLWDALDADHQAAILLAEQSMHKACQPLNDYANRSIDGLNSGLWLKVKVEQSAFACENAARALQSALNEL